MKTGNKPPIFNKTRAEKYENWYETKKGRHLDNLEKQVMFKLIQPRYQEKLLDVGCGTGHQLRWFSIFGLRLTGVDISEEMYAQFPVARSNPFGRRNRQSARYRRNRY